MILTIAVLVCAGWAISKLRPTRLGNDILKLEVFKHLRFRNAKDAAASMRYEDLEKRLWLQISVSIACVFGCSALSLKEMGLSLTSSLVISAVPTTIYVVIFMRFSRTYRHITLPLFATLCRMPQSHWDMRERPANWVKYRPKKQRLWIRLPKDWHADKRALETVRQVVASRLPGQWVMEADTRKFLLTFKGEPQPETVVVTGTPNPAVIDELDFTAMEKEYEDEPW